MAITDTYLSDPQWSPAPDSGVPCGENELYIDFVGGPYRITGLNAQQSKQLMKHFSEVCSQEPSEDRQAVSIKVFKAGPETFNLPDPPPEIRTFELDALPNQVNIAGENMYATIQLSGPVTGYLWTPDFDEYFHSNIFENFFRMVVTYHLLNTGGMLLHSAGIVNHDKAYLFPGRSDDGKSTLSRISINEGREVMSDDMNAVTWHSGKPWVEKVPFTGDLRENWSRGSSYPLAGLFAVRKSEASKVEELTASQALAFLTACTPYINADPHRIPLLLESLDKLTHQVPIHILNFSLSGEVWPVIESALQNGLNQKP